ncbi:MAG TPA: hypothetical protein VMT90_00830 [Dehalococcoidia bacterium]|jgi:hypothetical protein|nr:hypothetical protein [Dehalococcoidia bacterium]
MAKSQVIEQPNPVTEAPEVPTCQHHWKIDSPRGALSKGICKRCGEEREFRNSTTDYVWDDDSGQGYSPWRGIRSTPKASSDDGDDSMAASSRSSGRISLS